MKYYYSLRISSGDSIEKISEIIGVESNYKEVDWGFQVISDENDSTYYDFINEFLDLLENKYDKLYDMGISRKDIEIWMLYEYEGQCNIEFDPKDLKRLGDNEVSLCISCWDGGSN